VINGGIINAYGTNARMGESDWMVVEADESDGTFLKLPADVAIVTNIDPEHLDHFGTFDAIKAPSALRREPAVLRLRRDVHRPPVVQGWSADRGSPRRHLWRESAGRFPLIDIDLSGGQAKFTLADPRPQAPAATRSSAI
jgi:UDP-N-acetylmuramate--alanine ligase